MVWFYFSTSHTSHITNIQAVSSVYQYLIYLVIHFYHTHTCACARARTLSLSLSRFTICDKSELSDLVDTSVTWLHIFASVMYSSISSFKLPTPWREILLSRPTWMNILAQWGNIWGLFTLTTQAPTYFKFIHGWDIRMVSNIWLVTHVSDT